MNKPEACSRWSELAQAREAGEIETVVAGFTDHYGRLLGKRFDAELFVEEIAERGTHACDYLLTVDMEMEPVPGYAFANWELGYGDFHLVPDLATLRARELAREDRARALRRQDEKTHELVPSRRARSCAARSTRRDKPGFAAIAATELEHYLFRTSYRDAAQQGYRDLEPAGWYLEDYHILQGTRTEGFHAAARRHLEALRRAGRDLEGRMGPRPARAQRALRRGARHGRPPRVFKQCLKEIADGRGHERHLHGQARAPTGGLELPHPPQPVARRQERLRGSERRPDDASAGSSAAGSRTCPR